MHGKSIWLRRGKLLNVRDASAAQIAANAEIQAIKQIMGLQHGKVCWTCLHCIMVSCDGMSSCMAAAKRISLAAQQAGNSLLEIILSRFVYGRLSFCFTMVQVYTDVKQLRYGHLMIMTDQDHDGSHIKGLIMNYFHTFYPSLMKLPGFLIEFITPVIKVGHLTAYNSC